MLPQHLFLRIHRSFIVAIKKVTAFTNNDVEIGKTELPIGKSYSEVYRKLIGNHSFHVGEDQF
jgi:DNA-binding LytR/AlgR family response regulator